MKCRHRKVVQQVVSGGSDHQCFIVTNSENFGSVFGGVDRNNSSDMVITNQGRCYVRAAHRIM